ncbi:cytochrome c [Hydrogenophaga sp. OTU3427]|uniref:cytochrome c n=1 Tax=Hydrogenophaga sp. OTU3427 TaxID=3043856 RepID=UPI00313CC3A4
MSALSIRHLAGAALVLVLAAGGTLLGWLAWPARPIAVGHVPTTPADAATIARGRYLAQLGNCQACHTPRGGAPFAGGLGIATPYGTVYGSNLTPSAAGLGAWSADDFWRALHHGQSRDGRWLNPAFPYANTTHVSRPDSDALFAYLRSLPPDPTPAPAHAVRWPYNTQLALAAWRLLYFKPGDVPAEAPVAPAPGETAAAVRRGAYLVNGLAHCSACHAPRGALGGSRDPLSLAGGLIPGHHWYAPSLLDPADGGVQDWATQDIVDLFQSGRGGDAIVTGPMADVVQHGTQHWAAADLEALALYLKQLPRPTAAQRTRSASPSGASLDRGRALYDRHCADCHGDQGQGRAGADGRWAYVPLAGNRSVGQASPANLIQAVLAGGFGPSTGRHPQPYGMPPFVLRFNDAELADLLSFIRYSWGNQAPPVTELEVRQLRGPIGP